MTTKLSKSNKGLNSSSGDLMLGSTGNLKSRSFTNKSETKDYSNALENIEMEYIKNLQQQVYFLELECNYLRQQLKNDKQNRLRSSASSENLYNALDDIKKTFQKEKELLLDENFNLKEAKNELENRLKYATIEFDQTRTSLDKHHHEIKQSKKNFTFLEKQLDQLKKDNLRLRSEITDAREALNNRDVLIKDLQKQLNDHVHNKVNMHELRSSLNDVTVKLSMSKGALEKELETIHSLEDDKQRFIKEIAIYQQQLSDYKYENQKLNVTLETVLKQNETDLILAKKNAQIMKSNAEQLEYTLNEQRALNNNLQSQIDQLKLQEQNEIKIQFNLKTRVRELEESVKKNLTLDIELKQLRDEYISKQHVHDVERQKLIHEIDALRIENLDLERKLRDQNSFSDEKTRKHESHIELMRTKTESLQSTLDEQMNTIRNEKSTSKQLKLQIDNLQLQDKTNLKLISQLKAKIMDLETELHQTELKNNEIILLKNELNETQSVLNQKEDEIRQFKYDIKNLSLKLNEYERLKHIEEHIKLQRWDEFGTIAENMKLLTRSFMDNHKNEEKPYES